MDSSINPGGSALQLLLFAVFLLLAIFFLLTQQNTLRTIKRENRLMRPGQVWLQMIPLFGQVWQFFVVIRIAGSIQKEVVSWEGDSILGEEAALIEKGNKRPTLGIGIVYCLLDCICLITSWVTRGNAPAIVGLISLSAMVCWVSYWANLAGYKKKLRQKNLATL